MSDERLEYTCTNDSCYMYDGQFLLGSEAEAVCHSCGWMLSAVYEGGS